jgi:hypothetical protein
MLSIMPVRPAIFVIALAVFQLLKTLPQQLGLLIIVVVGLVQTSFAPFRAACPLLIEVLT